MGLRLVAAVSFAGVGPLRLAWVARWFRCVRFGRLRPSSVVSLVFLILDRVWCWVWSPAALVLVFSVLVWFLVVCAVVSFYYFLRSAPGVGFPWQKVENSRCILFVFR